MKNYRVWTRAGIVAVGLGIGGAFASTSAIASAESSFDWLSAVDSFLGGGALSAADSTPELNLAISFDGISLFQSGTAMAYSGTDSDFAVANGAGAVATAYGSGNYAYVDGVGSTATAGGLTADAASGSSANVAFVFGDNSDAYAGGFAGRDVLLPGISNYAIIFGNGDSALAGSDASGAGSYDIAFAEGNDLATAQAQGSDYLFDIAKFYGDGPTSSASAAATDLLGGDVSSLWAAGSAFWTDLFTGDLSGAVTEGNAFWAELGTLF